MIYCFISVAAGVIGFLLGAFIGHEDGYERGCQETHDYYHARGVRHA